MEPLWRVLIFLAPLCPICQNMSFDLRQLEADYAGDNVEFVGVFPNASTTAAQIQSFNDTYSLSMTMMQDTAGWAKTLGAKWTPEVFVFDFAASKGSSLQRIVLPQSGKQDLASAVIVIGDQQS